MLGSGAKVAKPSFVSYISPEVRGGGTRKGPRAARAAGGGRRSCEAAAARARGAGASPAGARWGLVRAAGAGLPLPSARRRAARPEFAAGRCEELGGAAAGRACGWRGRVLALPGALSRGWRGRCLGGASLGTERKYRACCFLRRRKKNIASRSVLRRLFFWCFTWVVFASSEQMSGCHRDCSACKVGLSHPVFLGVPHHHSRCVLCLCRLLLFSSVGPKRWGPSLTA